MLELPTTPYEFDDMRIASQFIERLATVACRCLIALNLDDTLIRRCLLGCHNYSTLRNGHPLSFNWLAVPRIRIRTNHILVFPLESW